ncbi:hypothetical protein MKX03_003239 [Papaver bracteatum]|nr:hypothetical protein MKX03_003239 [Papaver bracteatum]
MSEYENVVVGKLKLKGKALDVKEGGLKKKKKQKKLDQKEHPASIDDHLTPAERRYMEQRERIDVRRLAKT